MTKRNAPHYDGWVREIRWTDDSEAHIARHDVTPTEVEEVVYMRPRIVEPGKGGTEQVFGQTIAGRYLLVVLGEAEDGRSTIVTSRPMNDSERAKFKRRAH